MPSPFVRREEAAPIADVNVVPLADVSLVLLIILLVLSPMAAQSMLRVQTAAAKADADAGPKPGEDPLEPTPPEPVLAIGLTPLGYALDGRLLGSDAELKAWLAPELKRRDDKKVFLSPELDVPNGRVVGAIEAIQDCGASAVALVQVADPQAGETPGAAR
ncbi:MAG TPA: biopolymer transporter ExbD [Elusimicrobiota bacterium]|nr:biopolymer transporter ExbD [Elusimicrobiota bacterium]